MKQFKDLGIKAETRSFTGNSIGINKIINRPISLLDYKIGPSKYKDKGNGLCLTLHIKYDDEMRVVFTSGIALQEVLKKIPKEDFPFTTTIVREDLLLIFT